MSTAALQVSLQQKQTVVLACIKTRRKCGFLANKLYFLLSRKSAHNWLLISTGSGYLFLCGFTTADAQNLWCLYVCVSATKDITALLVFPSAISDIQLSVENSLRIQHENSAQVFHSAAKCIHNTSGHHKGLHISKQCQFHEPALTSCFKSN